jgi:hypothetical protein
MAAKNIRKENKVRNKECPDKLLSMPEKSESNLTSIQRCLLVILKYV